MLSAVKCRRDARLAKTRLTHVDADLVRVSETAVSSCEQKDDERFDDGTDTRSVRASRRTTRDSTTAPTRSWSSARRRANTAPPSGVIANTTVNVCRLSASDLAGGRPGPQQDRS